MQNKYVEDLIRFIKENEDWKDKLLHKPYSLKNILNVSYIPNSFMFNYNLFESELSNPIVKACRGTILEISPDRSVVKPVALPFYKFFNMGDVNGDTIDWTTAKSRDKVDGQLIKFFKVDGKNFWCTNGSPNVETPLDYTDDKIENYKDLLESAVLCRTIDTLAKKSERESYSLTGKDGAWHMYTTGKGTGPTGWIDNVPDGWTLMFELTSPYNRIIVKYDDIKLWFHGARDPEGLEHDPEDIKELFGLPYDVPKQYYFDGFDEAFAELDKWDGLAQEGIVVCDADFHRVKIKCEDYLKMKFIRDVDTPKGIFWIMISEEYDDLASYPDLQKKAVEQKDELISVMEKFKVFHKYVTDKRAEFPDQKSFAVDFANNQKSPSLYFQAAKKSEKDFIDGLMSSLKSETTGYDKYLELKNFIDNLSI